MAQRFRKKPVVIEAVQYTGRNLTEIIAFAGDKAETFGEDFLGNYVEIETKEGTMKADKNDWIIKGVQGEFYPCKPDIFEMTYEKA